MLKWEAAAPKSAFLALWKVALLFQFRDSLILSMHQIHSVTDIPPRSLYTLKVLLLVKLYDGVFNLCLGPYLVVILANKKTPALECDSLLTANLV